MAIDLEDCVVPAGMPIIDALRVLDRCGLSVILVCDDDRLLLGVCTDGDVRRHLIAGGTLEDPVSTCMNRAFTAIDHEVDRNTCLQRMLRQGFNCMPVVDGSGRLVDLHTLRTTLATSKQPNWAVIMAGGFGTRLGELTTATPKPMLPIGDRPILAHIVTHLVSHGIDRIFISINYLGSQIQDYFGDGTGYSCSIEYLVEDRPLGTGGSLRLLPSMPEAPLLVMNGDLLTRINVTRLLAFHRAGDFKATICLRQHKVSVPFGVAEVDGGFIRALVEKPSLEYNINAGIYVLDPLLLQRIPGDCLFPITELFNDCLTRDEQLGGYHMQEDWVDVGLPEQFQEAQSNDR